ncbi:hypothetical protein [Acinetobacter sp. YH12073]|uniref:hypothetical protein n=1 Tax=Acinetobacter sp. YH12073 TaxID=2601069 RepID=UPI0015D26F36|nr:hypothetical protein [Acinetobacter sp. YH12073]
MADRMEISKPIEIKDNSIERIAFDLMEKISQSESYYNLDEQKQKNPREYFLKLYNQCYKVVDYKGVDIDKLLGD